MQRATAIPRSSRVLADLLPNVVLRDALVVLGGAGLIGLSAQVAFPLPGTPVPVTGQTFGVLLTGCALGSRRAPLASALYVVLGLVGLPWFAHASAGWQGPSTGYLLGFVLTAALCGFLAERGADRTLWRALPTMLVGEVVTFICGVGWLGVDLHLSAAKAIALGLTPFLAGEGVKLAVAAGLLPATWSLIGRLDR